jgi:integrase
MAMQHLTQQFCERATITGGKAQETYQDDYKATREAVHGLALRVNPRGKSWVFLRAFNGQRYRTLGYFPATDLDAARRTAREWHSMMDKGVDPQGIAPTPADGGFDAKTFTLAHAFDCYAKWLRENGKSERTIEAVENRVDKTTGKELECETRRRWKDYLRRPLLSIRKSECKALHKAIKRELGGNPDDTDCTKGSSTANRILRVFQTTFARVAAEHDDFPKDAINPIRKGFGWFAEESRDGKVLWEELPAWWTETGKLSAIRRDAWRLILFTGLRNTDATSIRWEHVDLNKGTLHRPKPKGGKRKAFTVPLSTAALAILRGRQRDNAIDHGKPDDGWVFPTTSMKGVTVCIGKLKENVYTAEGRKITNAALKRPHDIRRTFQNAARKAGVNDYDYKVLMNHGRPRKAGNQSEQYNVAELEDLREETQRTTDFLLGKIGVGVVNSEFVAIEKSAAQRTATVAPQSTDALKALVDALGVEKVKALADLLLSQNKGAA